MYPVRSEAQQKLRRKYQERTDSSVVKKESPCGRQVKRHTVLVQKQRPVLGHFVGGQLSGGAENTIEASFEQEIVD
jgi:hypothetical protein